MFPEGMSPVDGGDLAHIAGIEPGVTFDTSPLRTQVVHTAIATSHVLLAAAGTLYSCRLQIDATAPGGVYYVTILNYAAAQTNGVRNVLLAPIPITHTQGVDDYITIPVGNGVACSVGAVATLSTSLTPASDGPPATMTLTLPGSAYLWLNGAEVGS